MRRLLAIGIGAGDPEHLTLQAVRALGELDVVFVVDKGEQAAELTALRRELLARHAPGARVVEIPDPPRDRSAEGYVEAVEDWRARRGEAWRAAIAAEQGVGGFLVWGDPSLYDSTLAILDSLGLQVSVIPGISSVHALTARHAIALNRVGGAVQITTGRRLTAGGWPAGVGDVVVMLDPDCAFLGFPDADIYWGAYLGGDDEILVSGRVGDVGEEIVRRRAQARARKGWIMDTYLLRSRSSE
ncbi:MAG TPA: precorrin-6A synthase (deacetylating) [Solirubrobacteraceae bacterium]|jgi:precorrin-6A synthase|nr:precorrin-6A synthase (deacetylating) [Solirubrobacteraceae bacterium]